MAEAAVKWVRDNKLQSVGLLWATAVSSGIAYNWSKPISPSLKIIHARVYAQGVTLAALVASAGVELFLDPPAPEADPYAYKPHRPPTAAAALERQGVVPIAVALLPASSRAAVAGSR